MSDEQWLDNKANSVDEQHVLEALELASNPHDVLKAVSTIGKYIDDLNGPIACKIDALLKSFKMQLCLDDARSMKDTVLTDFFQRV